MTDWINKQKEIRYITTLLRESLGVYLLESVVGEDKDYSVADIHAWGQEEGCIQAYRKLGDLHKVRIYEAVEGDKLDRVLASEMLKPYYKEQEKVREAEVSSTSIHIYLPEQRVLT
jgi:hypothetical protein